MCCHKHPDMNGILAWTCLKASDLQSWVCMWWRLFDRPRHRGLAVCTRQVQTRLLLRQLQVLLPPDQTATRQLMVCQQCLPNHCCATVPLAAL